MRTRLPFSSTAATRAVGSSSFDPVRAYRMMLRMRLVDEALGTAWADGLIPGEYHSGIGEEGINAGVLLHLSGFDTMALDHRNTAPFIGRGADPVALMLEVLGSEEGMNQGRAGHMHLADPGLRAAADGIVGAAGPLAVGNAIANARLHPGAVAVAFHGEGATNQGMLLEAYNLAAAWHLPVVFVCKDNRWSITTHSSDVTGGGALSRARSLGLEATSARGERVDEVYAAADRLIRRARGDRGPGFLYVTCHRPGGHFEGDPILRLLRNPRRQAAEWGPALLAAASASVGGTRRSRAASLAILGRRGVLATREWTLGPRRDPVERCRVLLDGHAADRIDAEERAEIRAAVETARARVGPRPTFGETEKPR